MLSSPITGFASSSLVSPRRIDLYPNVYQAEPQTKTTDDPRNNTKHEITAAIALSSYGFVDPGNFFAGLRSSSDVSDCKLRLDCGTRDGRDPLLPFRRSERSKLGQLSGCNHQFPHACDNDELERRSWFCCFVELGQLCVTPLGCRRVARGQVRHRFQSCIRDH